MGLIVLFFFLITIIVCSLIYLIFKLKKSKLNPLKTPYYWVISFITIPVVFVGIIMTWYFISTSFQKKEFNKISWDQNIELRYELVDDLIDKKTLIGLSPEEIIILLGEVDYTNDNTFGYYIGYSKQVFMNQDPDWLEIEFVDNKANSAKYQP